MALKKKHGSVNPLTCRLDGYRVHYYLRARITGGETTNFFVRSFCFHYLSVSSFQTAAMTCDHTSPSFPPSPSHREGCILIVCVFFPFILDIKFVGRTSRGHTGGRSHRISHPPFFCGACLDFSRKKDSVEFFVY